jgi:hypothetical protein
MQIKCPAQADFIPEHLCERVAQQIWIMEHQHDRFLLPDLDDHQATLEERREVGATESQNAVCDILDWVNLIPCRC